MVQHANSDHRSSRPARGVTVCLSHIDPRVPESARANGDESGHERARDDHEGCSPRVLPSPHAEAAVRGLIAGSLKGRLQGLGRMSDRGLNAQRKLVDPEVCPVRGRGAGQVRSRNVTARTPARRSALTFAPMNARPHPMDRHPTQERRITMMNGERDEPLTEEFPGTIYCGRGDRGHLR